MIQDPNNRYLAAICSAYDLRGREVLEVGCGRGRISRDLAGLVGHLIATDPDAAAVAAARQAVNAPHVEFRVEPTGLPALAPASRDMVIYTLSLHHVPLDGMADSLGRAAAMLRHDGVILVLEPGDQGSFTVAKERFGAGSGDERPARRAADRALHSLEGWTAGETILFYTQFLFSDEADFTASMLPGFESSASAFRAEVHHYLSRYRSGAGIILDAERRLNVLRRNRVKS